MCAIGVIMVIEWCCDWLWYSACWCGDSVWAERNGDGGVVVCVFGMGSSVVMVVLCGCNLGSSRV